MSTRRERQQLAQRLRKGRRRRKAPRPAPPATPQPPDQACEPPWTPDDVLIGYIAHVGYEALCHEEAPLIIGERHQMERKLEQQGRTEMTIRPATFEDLAVSFLQGVPLCFDDGALVRFYEASQQAGMPIEQLIGRLDKRRPARPGEPAMRLQIDFGCC